MDVEERRTESGIEDVWELEVDSLDELVGLSRRVGDLVVGPWWFDRDRMSIEIYDTYRE